MIAVGIDVGGTSIKGATIKDDGTVLDRFAMDVDKTLPPEVEIEKLCNLVNECLRTHKYDEKILGIGIGIPGLFDFVKGPIRLTNLPTWNGFPLAQFMQERCGLPVYINNDANVAALAEARFGSGKEYKNMIMLTLGTGVGGGIIIDNKLYDGHKHMGAELGHMVIRMGGNQCGCGRKGCFEAYASATALINDTKKEMEKHPESKMNEIAANLGKINAKVPFLACKEGDKAGMRVVNRYVKYLSEGILNYCNIFRPEAVILSGGVANEGEYLLAKVRRYLKKHHYGMNNSPKVEVRLASLGYDSGKIGAACLVLFK